MIIVNLKGGLGNQMFEYAAARALSLRNNDILKLDISSLDNAEKIGNIYRPFSIQNFNIKIELASPEEVDVIKGKKGLISTLINKFILKYIYKYYISFHKSILENRGDVYLDGYFQSENYFIDFEEEIRNDFTPRLPLEGKAKEWQDKIMNDSNSVSMHIRRGDYVAHRDFGGICTKDYFENAARVMVDKYPSSNFYIFSDDIEWVKNNINIETTKYYVSKDKLNDFEDIILMSKCKNNILSNSSFSWWGAWLNRNEDKTIIAPKKWTNLTNSNFKDLIPLNWIRL